MYKIQTANIIALAAILGMTAAPSISLADSMTEEEYRAELAERDALIAALQQQIYALENRQPQAENTPAEPRRADASRLTVDLVAAERALERTLISAGALLLPQGAIELTPSVAYSVAEFDVPTVLNTDDGDQLALLGVKRATTSLGLTARIGLPFDSQLELGIPYQSVTEESTLTLASAPISRSKATGRGTGDLRVGLSKTLLRENGWVPDIVGRVTWNSEQGTETDNGVFLGGGYSSLSGSVSMVKRLDPLALLFSVDYQDFRRQSDLTPGDAFGVSLGTGLAVSPTSSMFGSLNHRSISESRIDGERIAGSNLDVTSLTIGFGTILRRGTLLNLYSEVGMSDDAADFTIGFSVPIRAR